MSELQVGGANEDDDTHHHALFFWGALDTWDVRFSPLPHFSNFVAGKFCSHLVVVRGCRWLCLLVVIFNFNLFFFLLCFFVFVIDDPSRVETLSCK